MARPMPLTLADRIRLTQREKRSKNDTIIAPAISPSKKVEVKYRRDLNLLIKNMTEDVFKTVMPFLRQNQREFVQDASFVVPLGDIMEAFKKKYRDIDRFSKKVASDAVIGEATNNVEKFNKGVERVSGISLQRVINQEELTETIQSQIRVNVDLIQSIPDQYYKQLSEIVYSGINEGDTPFSMAREIFKLGRTTKNRAKMIARDQTQKTNALITQKRQESLGVEEYVWQTSADNRVRKTHRDNNGKVFRWDKPDPVTGHPGHDVNCRCVARAIINL